ncbi:hypothetical protein [Pseudofrankia asymbiotica]|uniref:Uncharacterized protein n=1 Tax=Pseudofrankia asymbiotica TaxID=1834516 RepID=A0A1V2I9T4_9ACTN|nr:hypothetical protein [Pseudofrankia asymbiotica]ONH29496.1 hypothetical protein BL253_16645 [Pseudofrankia asymbiotica]
MQLRRVILVSALALGLAGSGTAAANAAGVLPGSEGPTGHTTACPAPGDPAVDDVQVKDGKIYHNGQLVGEAEPGSPVAITRDGKVHIGTDAETLPRPADAKESLVTAGSPGGGVDEKGFTCEIDGADQ